MYKIKISDLVFSKVDFFINSFYSTFVKMYTNTWIEDEDLIRKTYIDIWMNFKDLVIKEIFKVFEDEKIFWVWELNWFLFITLSIKNYRFFIYFKEDKNKKIRYIEDIKIFKK